MPIYGKQLAALTITTALIAANQVTSAKVDGTVLSTAAPGAGASWDAGSRKIANLLDPTAAQDAASKAYVDATKQGLDIKDSVRVATNAALPAYTRTGSVITMSAVGVVTVDGVATVLNDRILVKDGQAGSDNGLYSVTTEGTAGVAAVLTRTTDADSNAKVTAGLYTFVAEGTANADGGFVLTTNDPINLNTTALTFTQFTGAGQITAGVGLTKTGNTIDVGSASVGLTLNADSLAVIYGLVAELTAVDAGDAAAAGTLDKAARVDHQHAVSTAAPTVTVKSEATATAVGTATTLLRADMQIQAATAAASDLATSLGQGNSSSLARADHTHRGPKPSLNNQKQASAATTAVNQTTGLTITATPVLGGIVRAFLNGIELEVGDAVKTKDFYYSVDAGVTARAMSAIVAADTLFWTKTSTRENYDLATTDVITQSYETF